jgi:error-prone DNA polymerase
MGLTLLPPDVNESELPYTGSDCTVRVGLMQLKGIRMAALEALLDERGRAGPFRSLEDLLRRVAIDPSDARILIKAGCLDSIAQGRSRPELLWQLLGWEEKRKGKGEREKQGQGRGQSGLRSHHPDTAVCECRTLRGAKRRGNPPAQSPRWAGRLPRRPPLADSSQPPDYRSMAIATARPRDLRGCHARGSQSPGWEDTRAEEATPSCCAPDLFEATFEPPKASPYDAALSLRHEMETLGVLVSRHPLELYEPWLSRFPTVPAANLAEHVGKRVTVAGWFVTGKTVLTRKSEPMEFVSFEDVTALYETTFFPRAYERYDNLLTVTRPYLLRGLVEEDFGAVSLTVEEVIPLTCQGSVVRGQLSGGDFHA